MDGGVGYDLGNENGAGLAASDEDKRNVSTQVDYVQLIMSRNEDAARLIDKAYADVIEQNQMSLQGPHQGMITSSHAQLNSFDHSMHTVNVDPHMETGE